MAPPTGFEPRLGEVAGVVLAAGSSTRFGGNKLLAQVGGEPLVRRAARMALAAGLSPVLVVTGHEAALAEMALTGLACRAVRNPDHARGQGTSLRAGLDALPPAVAGAVVLLADMPLVTIEMVAALVARWREGDAALVASRYGGADEDATPAPPTLYDRSLFAELTEPGDRPGRAVVQRHRASAAWLRWPAEAALDLDAPEDLERLPPDDLTRLSPGARSDP
jgi:molybdenum cofactor cytidylyltransferase